MTVQTVYIKKKASFFFFTEMGIYLGVHTQTGEHI